MLCFAKTIFALFLISIVRSKSECINSYHTLCDDLSDLKTLSNENKASIRELVIGSENTKRNELHSADILLYLEKFYGLKYLVVTNQLKRLVADNFHSEHQWPYKLEYVYFYKNDFNRIKDESIMFLNLKKLSLANNNIEYIHKKAFKHCEIEILDLSDNKLNIIEVKAFNQDALGNVTKELILKKNRIEDIEAGALPISLQILDLSDNKLTTPPVEGLNYLSNLIELYLSHNKIEKYPSLLNLKKLEILDLSYNNITVFDKDTIDKLPKLEILDLSHNIITEISGTAPLSITRSAQLHREVYQLSLAFNHLVHINAEILKSFAPFTLYLGGNPWSCKCWDEMVKLLNKEETGVYWNRCDAEFVTKGVAPYCILNNASVACKDFTPLDMLLLHHRDDLNKFIDTVKNSEKKIECEMKPRRLIPQQDFDVIDLHF